MGWMSEAFAKQKIESPRLCAEILLSHVLRLDRLKLYTDPDREAQAHELTALRSLVSRGLKHEPVQYLTAQAFFFGLALTVDRRVLIPRPCTETIVELVIQEVRKRAVPPPPVPAAEPDNPATEAVDQPAAGAPAAQARASMPTRFNPLAVPVTVADVCTGSGCIALALARHLPRASVVGTDLSAEALELASLNAGALTLDNRVEWRQGNLLEPLGSQRFDFLVSNPPYIPDFEWDAVPANVRNYEPHTALRGGPDGLSLVGPILSQSPAQLKPGGMLLVEIAASTAPAVLAAAKHTEGLTECRIVKDLEGHDRVLVARRIG